jgi:DNA-binding NarL/FixJ family response regulator
LVDDHILFREGLSRLLTSEPDLQFAGNCGTSHEVFEIRQDTRVEMILLDFDIGDHGGKFICGSRPRRIWRQDLDGNSWNERQSLPSL